MPVSKANPGVSYSAEQRESAAKINALKLDKPILPEGLKNGAGTIIIDPPWDVQQKGNFGAIKHYDLMTLEQIKAMPVGDLCAENACVWLWATAATLPHAYEILKGWGLTPRAPFVWVKNRMGLGQYVRNFCEFCVIGTRGKALPAIKNQPNVGLFPVIPPHSRKPSEMYDIVERMYPDVPRLELFARIRRPGWRIWGNEAPGGSDIVIPGYPVPAYSDAVMEKIEKVRPGKEAK